MLTLHGPGVSRNCDGSSRREFLRIGAVGASALTLPNVLRARAAAAGIGKPTVSDTSVIWLWLGGGATHIETFDPKPNAPAEFRSTVGAVSTSLPGVQFGGLFPRLAKQAKHLAVVRSFAHGNSGHAGGTHWVMTGYNHIPADQGAAATRPGYGSIVSKMRGANHEVTGVPTYVRLRNIFADGPAWLGAGCGPFDSAGQARANMAMSVKLNRLADRRNLLDKLDTMNRQVDRSGLMDGLDAFEVQAFELILSEARQAFDVSKEKSNVRARYGQGIGEQLLLARRLCEAGCGFVTVNYPGWDMHQRIADSLGRRCPALDQGIAALIEDLVDRGLDRRVLVVIAGEFGRTPRVNRNAGRDHWAPLSTLALACGGLNTGQVIGESSAKAEVPKSRPISPQDLMATLFHVLKLPCDLSFRDPAGRPTPMITTGRPIAELV